MRFLFSFILFKVAITSLHKVLVDQIETISIRSTKRNICLIFVSSIYFIDFHFLFCALFLFARLNFAIIISYNCDTHLFSYFWLYQIFSNFIFSFSMLLLCFCQFFCNCISSYGLLGSKVIIIS